MSFFTGPACASPCTWRHNCDWWAMAIRGKAKGSEFHHRAEFLHNYYTFQSAHDGDHDSVVRIFVGLSCEL